MGRVEISAEGLTRRPPSGSMTSMTENQTPAEPQFIIAAGCRGTEFEIHGVQCGDLRRKWARGERFNTWRVTAPDAKTAVAREVADFEAQDQGWAASDFKVFDCCKAQVVLARFGVTE